MCVAAARSPVADSYDAGSFARDTGVSRETLGRLETFATLLGRWQQRINLVARESVADLWRRHFLDSAQLLPLIPAGSGRLIDLGSGAGFPGLVLSILGASDVHLIESDGRKAAFLREAARLSGASVTIHAGRIEEATRLAETADVVTARALAPLDALLGHAAPLLRPGGCCLFLKGARAADELTLARKAWNMDVQQVPSRSHPAGVVLKLKAIARAE